MKQALQKKLQEGMTQIEVFLTDEQLANRPDLKKYVIVFSCHKAKPGHELD